MPGSRTPERAAGPHPGDRLRVLVCPDAFKGTVSAGDAAAALRDGWLAARPGDHVTAVPMADGGEGTMDALRATDAGATRHPVRVSDPLGAPHETEWLLLSDGTAVVELAATSGITLLSAPAGMEASTTGVGEAIGAALARSPHRLLVALGGSASTDGGAGLLGALGARLLDTRGAAIGPGARGLGDLATVDLSGLPPVPPGGADVLTDVMSPLLGPRGAAAVFGPQKGLTPAEIAAADRGLARLARLLGVDPDLPGSGAAGGTAAALVAWGARIVPGAPAIAEAAGLTGLIAQADVVITGEGRFDEQSTRGKVVGHVAELAARSGTPLSIVAGTVDAPVPAGAWSASLAGVAGSAAAAREDAVPVLRAAAAHLARQVTARGGDAPW